GGDGDELLQLPVPEVPVSGEQDRDLVTVGGGKHSAELLEERVAGGDHHVAEARVERLLEARLREAREAAAVDADNCPDAGQESNGVEVLQRAHSVAEIVSFHCPEGSISTPSMRDTRGSTAAARSRSKSSCPPGAPGTVVPWRARSPIW